MAGKPPEPQIRIERTLRQICTADGTPYQAYASSCVWGKEADPYPKTDGNKVEPIFSGEAYYRQLHDAIMQAKNSICMLGWQINWDVPLITGGDNLYDLLAKAATDPARSQLKIYILPWDDSAPVTTYDDQTVAVVNSINELIKGPRRVFAQLAKEHPASAEGMDLYYSHHQKLVVIDDQVAFMGGIDVCWGRRDNGNYALDATGRHGGDVYNGCIEPLGHANGQDYVHGDLIARPEKTQTRGGVITHTDVIHAKHRLRQGKALQFPAGGTMPDAAIQPRMPWQDLQLKITGPAVSHLSTNFVLRWNMAAADNTFSSLPKLNLPPEPRSYANQGGHCVQMLRSASYKMVDSEKKAMSKGEQSRLHAEFGHNHIHHAMVRLIEHAEHFIYIENQFFSTGYGPEGFGDTPPTVSGRSPEITLVDSTLNNTLTQNLPYTGDGKLPPRNYIGQALGGKMRDVIMNIATPVPDGKYSPFHVYITLPVHPEGKLNDPVIMTQVHHTMQSLVFGKQSLLNRIRRAIKARLLLAAKDKGYARVFEDGNDEYKSVPINHCWAYVTLLNLRNHGELAGRPVTEQIYVHTKMMVVDDRYAIVGSANINDRSQLGDRDSELAVLVMDTEWAYEDVGAKDEPVTVTRKFARELRMGVWKKIFGSAADVLDDAIKRPAAQESWTSIRRYASRNTEAYEAVFPHVPRNDAKIWPTITMEGGKRLSGQMPFDAEFWRPQNNAAYIKNAVSELKRIQGYITLLPWSWTIGQDNKSGLHSALIVHNDRVKQSDMSSGATEFAEAGTSRTGKDDHHAT
jgi:phospholipase D1/2